MVSGYRICVPEVKTDWGVHQNGLHFPFAYSRGSHIAGFLAVKWGLFLAGINPQQLENLKSILLKSGGEMHNSHKAFAMFFHPTRKAQQSPPHREVFIYSIHVEGLKGRCCGWIFVMLPCRPFPLNYKHLFRIALHGCCASWPKYPAFANSIAECGHIEMKSWRTEYWPIFGASALLLDIQLLRWAN